MLATGFGEKHDKKLSWQEQFYLVVTWLNVRSCTAPCTALYVNYGFIINSFFLPLRPNLLLRLFFFFSLPLDLFLIFDVKIANIKLLETWHDVV